MDIAKSQRSCRDIIDRAGTYFVSGSDAFLEKVLCGILGGGHILFEDNPGLGKTMLVKVFSAALGCSWKRIQFTPDLMPADIVGTKIFDMKNAGFALEKGPIFTNLLLADEINRAMPKTQSALLEAMEEKQVTIEGETHRLSAPFTVMATQNPIENEGTYPLPEAQMDRFLIRLAMGYLPNLDLECEILKRRIVWMQDDPTDIIAPAIDQARLVELQQEAERVYIDESIIRYIGTIVRATREEKQFKVGSSPRGGLALLKLSRAMALIRGRSFVVPDDVKEIAVPALAHRVILDMEYMLEGIDTGGLVRAIVEKVPAPKEFRPRA